MAERKRNALVLKNRIAELEAEVESVRLQAIYDFATKAIDSLQKSRGTWHDPFIMEVIDKMVVIRDQLIREVQDARTKPV